MSRSLPAKQSLAAATVAVCLALVPVATADGGKDGRDEIRQAGVCSASSRSKLRLRADDGRIRVDLEVDTSRNGATWAVILLHERRIVFRGRLRTAAPSGSFELRRTVADWFGTDTIVARATGPAAEVCRASATL